MTTTVHTCTTAVTVPKVQAAPNSKLKLKPCRVLLYNRRHVASGKSIGYPQIKTQPNVGLVCAVPSVLYQ